MATIGAIALALSALGLDFLTALSGAATAVANVGPGLGNTIGPAGGFLDTPGRCPTDPRHATWSPRNHDRNGAPHPQLLAGLAYRFRVRTSGGSEIAALKLAVNVGETLLQLVDQSVKLFPSQPFGFQLAYLTQNLGQAPRQGGVRIKSFEAPAKGEKRARHGSREARRLRKKRSTDSERMARCISRRYIW